MSPVTCNGRNKPAGGFVTEALAQRPPREQLERVDDP